MPDELDERQQKILQAVVWSYIETAEPVGSENLAQRHSDWGVKSATIRNTLAGLADTGYLLQPHTSAGRIPSDRGYRFYVDNLMADRQPSDETVARTRDDLDAERADTLTRILRQACTLLSSMTRYTSLATPPRPAEILVRQCFAAPAGPNALLVVVMLSTGNSDHRILAGAPASLAMSEPAALTEALNAMNNHVTGRSLDLLRSPIDPNIPLQLSSDAAKRLFLALGESMQALAKNLSEETERVVVEGATEILHQPEFKDVSKLEGVFQALQTRSGIIDLLTQILETPDTAVVIGTENPVESMKSCTVITAHYFVGSRERGTLGVVGPTRMDYDRTIPMVNLVARTLSDMLTRMA